MADPVAPEQGAPLEWQETERAAPPMPRSPPRRSRSRDRSPSPRRSRNRSRSRSRSPRGRPVHDDRFNPTPSLVMGVFGLSIYSREEDVQRLFERVGPVEKVDIIYDRQTGRSKGFGFVYYKDINDAKRAKEILNGEELNGRNVRVDYSVTKRAHTPTPGRYMGQRTESRYEPYARRDRFNDRRDYDRRGRYDEYDRRDRYDDHDRRDDYDRRRYRRSRSPRRSRSRSYSRSPRRSRSRSRSASPTRYRR
eukprot:TRINITY_DN33920_c0_g1_i1.p1 TRINITY_DN33920_c0_g1~~TRINITY_DN33920_c0_g1_i1.p1  ORF type:complete len:264 (-),score=11.89 TRINITY_DN33920_c0_g1_i1:48-797(-)